jgi:hypothetical protein
VDDAKAADAGVTGESEPVHELAARRACAKTVLDRDGETVATQDRAADRPGIDD